MTIYKLGEHTLAVIDGQLWMALPPVIIPVEVPSPEPNAATRPGRPAKQIHKHRKGGIDPEIKAAIYREYIAGATIAELAKKYKTISYGTVYATCKNGSSIPRAKHNSGEPLKLSVKPKWFTCEMGHSFESKLPLSHARCPSCRSMAVSEHEEKPVLEESL